MKTKEWFHKAKEDIFHLLVDILSVKGNLSITEKFNVEAAILASKVKQTEAMLSFTSDPG